MAAWIDNLKALSELKPDKVQAKAIIDELLSDEHDRGAALVAATFLETNLQLFLKSRLVTLTKSEEEGLFSRDAPLASFSKLIRVSYAFGLIDGEV